MRKTHNAQVENLCHQGFRTFERSLLLKIPNSIHTLTKGMMLTDDLDNSKNFGGTGFQPVRTVVDLSLT